MDLSTDVPGTTAATAVNLKFRDKAVVLFTEVLSHTREEGTTVLIRVFPAPRSVP